MCRVLISREKKEGEDWLALFWPSESEKYSQVKEFSDLRERFQSLPSDFNYFQSLLSCRFGVQIEMYCQPPTTSPREQSALLHDLFNSE